MNSFATGLDFICLGFMIFDNHSWITGVNLSLLSRVMSSRLSRGTYNGGLLSTEAGTIARVIADATITVAGYLGVSRLLNITLLPSLFICIASILATCYTYNSLYWYPWLVAMEKEEWCFTWALIIALLYVCFEKVSTLLFHLSISFWSIKSLNSAM